MLQLPYLIVLSMALSVNLAIMLIVLTVIQIIHYMATHAVRLPLMMFLAVQSINLHALIDVSSAKSVSTW